MTDPVQFMSHHTAVEYKVPEPSLLERPLRRAARAGADHRSQVPAVRRRSTCRRAATARCASSRPPRPTRSRSPTAGTITTFSVITPLQYQGQQETEDYVQGTILLDGADTTIMVMRHGRHRDRRRAHGHARAGGVAARRRSVRRRRRVGRSAAWASATRWSAGNRPASPTSPVSSSRSTFCDGVTLMRDVAIVSFAQAPLEQAPGQTETLMLLPTITEALADRRA